MLNFSYPSIAAPEYLMDPVLMYSVLSQFTPPAATILARAFGGDDLGYIRKRGGDDLGLMLARGGDDLGIVARRRGGDSDAD